MKNKLLKLCKAKGCNKKFKPYKTTDKFCCWECFNSSKVQKKKILNKPIKKQSDKSKAASFIYKKKRLTFLMNKENFWCPVAREIFGEEIPAEEIHHKKGRVGNLLNYVPFWLAVCRKGHVWIHQNPKEAYEKGFLIHSSNKF